jgi:predicted PurR-regulated permease PerM
MAISAWIQQRRSLIFLFILLAALLPILVRIAWPFLTAIVLASIIAIIMNPVKEWLCVRLGRAGLATILTTFATIAILGIVLTVVGFTLTREVTTLYEEFSQNSLREGDWPALVTATSNRIVDALATRLPINKEAIQTELMNGMKAVSGYLVGNIGLAFSEITHFLVTGLMVTIILYCLLKWGEDWVARILSLTPLDTAIAGNLIKAIHSSVVANVNGTLAVVAAQGVLLYLGFWFLGMRSPLLWGAIGGLFSIIPVVGASLVWGPVVIGFLIMGAYWKALILCLWAALVVGSADNVLRSIIVGKHEKQHPMLIAFAAIGGTYAFGILGILLGPLVISLTAALVKEINQLISSEKITDPETLQDLP